MTTPGPRFMRQVTVEESNNACEPSTANPVSAHDPTSDDLPPQDDSSGNGNGSNVVLTSQSSRGGLPPPPGFAGLFMARQVTVENGSNSGDGPTQAQLDAANSDDLPPQHDSSNDRTAAPVAAIGGGGLLMLRRHVTVAGPSGETISDNPVGTAIDPDSDDLPPMVAPPGIALGGAGSPLFARHNTVGVTDNNNDSTSSSSAGHGIDPDSEELPPQAGSDNTGTVGNGMLAPPGFPSLRISRQVTVEHPNDDSSAPSASSHAADSDDLPPQPSSPSSSSSSSSSSSTLSIPSTTAAVTTGGLRLMRHVTVADASGRSSSDDPVGGHH